MSNFRCFRQFFVKSQMSTGTGTYPNPATVVTEALIYTWRQILYTGNIFLANSENNQASNWKMARIFLMVYKLEWKS
jgi:hypothetical protein